MSWSYGGDPSASAKDEMRFVLGDTINMQIFPLPAPVGLLSDEEINYALNKYAAGYTPSLGGGTFFLAAKILCEALVSKFSPYVNEATGDESVQAADRITKYRQLALDFANKIAYNGLSIYVGGVSKTENEKIDSNDDLRKPQFAIGMEDNPFAVQRIFRNRDNVNDSGD